MAESFVNDAIAKFRTEEMLKEELFLASIRIEASNNFDFRAAPAALAAVKAIISVAKSINSMKAENDKAAALEEISQKLSIIISELGEIKSLLTDIKAKLDQIENKIEEKIYSDARSSNYALQQFISENYSYWKSIEEQSLLDDARQARADLVRNNRLLMTGDKVSYIFDLIISFSFELDMALLLNIPANTTKNAVKKMVSYLEDSLNPSLQGSIVFYYNASKPTYDDLLDWESSLVREQFLGTKTFTAEESIYNYVYCTGDFYDIVDGSLKEDNLRRVKQIRNERNCYTVPNEGGVLRYLEGETAQEDRRALASYEEIARNQKRFSQHASVVDFCEIAIPGIKEAIDQIKERLEKQLTSQE